MRAVLADIVKGAQLAVPVADNCNGTACDRRGGVGARRAHFFDVADPDPMLGEDRILFKSVPFGVSIRLCPQRKRSRRVGVKARANGGEVLGCHLDGHVWRSD